MSKLIIRNDDVAYDTKLTELKKFCEICDKYKVKIIQAITPFGDCLKDKSAKLTNDQIKALSLGKFSDNKEVVNYLLSRDDLIAVHGLWHTHYPSLDEIKKAKEILTNLGFKPTYFVPPFNEGDYDNKVLDLKTSILSDKKGERLESFLDKGVPSSKTVYLHSWRFDDNWYTFEKLESCLKRIMQQ